MEKYLFEGEIQGQYKSLEIYPKPDFPNEYLVQWDGFKVGTIKKDDSSWHSDDAPLVDFVGEIGDFIDRHEATIKNQK